MKRTSSRCHWLQPADALFLSLVSVAMLVATPAAASGPGAPTLLADPAPAPSGGEELYLQVTLNRTDTGKLARFVRRDGRLYTSTDTLRQLGFHLSGHDSTDDIALDSLPEVVFRYDAALQQISLDAPLSLLSLDTTLLNAPDRKSVV